MFCRYAAYEALMTYPGGLQVGGGVNAGNAIDYLNAGASHVIVTSYVFREGRLEEECLRGLVCAWRLLPQAPCRTNLHPC